MAEYSPPTAAAVGLVGQWQSGQVERLAHGRPLSQVEFAGLGRQGRPVFRHRPRARRQRKGALAAAGPGRPGGDASPPVRSATPAPTRAGYGFGVPEATERDEVMSLRINPGGLLRLSWAPGLRIDADLAQQAMDAVNAMCAGQERPLMVDMTATAALSRGARQVFARRSAASRIALVGRSAVDRVSANFALGVSAVPVPTRFFTSAEAATTWLLDVDRR